MRYKTKQSDPLGDLKQKETLGIRKLKTERPIRRQDFAKKR